MENNTNGAAIYVTSSGVKLGLRRIRLMTVGKALGEIEYPEPPIIHLDEKDRDEPNPNDPTYKRLVDKADAAKSQLTIDTYLGLGTKLIEVPTDVPEPDSDEWAEEIESILGIRAPSDKYKRYVWWLRNVALESDDEATKLINKVMEFNGMVLADLIEESVDSFRDNEEWIPDPTVSDKEVS